jgi:hypothetical protein
MPLRELAEIRSPYTFRPNPNDRSPHNAYTFSIGDLVNAWPIDVSTLTPVHVDERRLKDAVAPGELVMPARGTACSARLFTHPQVALFPSSQVHMIAAREANDREYLLWWLNHPSTQQLLQSRLSGTTIKGITKAQLMTLEVPLPVPAVRTAIGRAYFLHLERQSSMRSLMVKLDEEIDIALMLAATGDNNE